MAGKSRLAVDLYKNIGENSKYKWPGSETLKYLARRDIAKGHNLAIIEK